MNMSNELFVCSCNDLEHQFVISYIEDDYSEMYLSVNLATGNFWKRLKIGLKYIFGKKSKYGQFDEILIRPEDANRLQEIVNKLKLCKEK